MFSANNKVKVIDFGLASIIDPKTPETIICGSPGYLAPEVFTGKGYDTKIDIFSIGSVLYAM